jgi:hypothetical protein
VPASATTGVCGIGGGVGAACHVLLSGGVIDSDCAPGLRCLPDAGGNLVCSLGHENGQSCAVPAGVTVAGELCRTGFCKPGVAGPVCAAPGVRGAACDDNNPCAAGLDCPEGTCTPEEIPAGEACGSGDPRKCVEGTFCKTVSSAPDAAGTCAPLRAENEACQPDECAPPGDCQNNVCHRCM